VLEAQPLAGEIDYILEGAGRERRAHMNAVFIRRLSRNVPDLQRDGFAELEEIRAAGIAAFKEADVWNGYRDP